MIFAEFLDAITPQLESVGRIVPVQPCPISIIDGQVLLG